MSKRLKAILFDIDDTLFDREAAQKLSLEFTVQKFLPLLGVFSKEKLKQAWEESDLMTVVEFNARAFDRNSRSRHFLKLLGLSQDQADELTQLYIEKYPTLNVPVVGAIELIHELKDRVKMGVISNSLPDVQYGKLKTLGVKDIMACIVLSEEYGIRKPDPRVFQYAAQLLEVETSECLFVGDSFATDIMGAKSAGMLACWLKRGKPINETNTTADFVINELSQILPNLKQTGLLD